MNVESSRQSKGLGRSTLLLVGSGVLADTLAKHLATPEVEVLRTARAGMFDAVQPGAANLVVLVGDAAAERGTPVIRETLKRFGADAPLMVVVTAPQIGGLSPQPMPAGAAMLTPEGGMVECARRLRVMLARLHEGALEQSSLQQIVDDTSRKATSASATRPRQQTLLGPASGGVPAARPVSGRIDIRTHGAPAAISGAKPVSVPSIAAVVSKAVAAEPQQPVEMLWGETTPTVVARAKSKQSEPGAPVPVALGPGETPVPQPQAEIEPAPVPSGSPSPPEALPVGAKPRQRQPTLHGQAPLSISALAGAGGAVGVEVRIRTASSQGMQKVTVPEPSGSLPPAAAVVAPEISVRPEPQARTEASVEISLESLEPPVVAFSAAPGGPESPTPIAISIPSQSEREAQPELDTVFAEAKPSRFRSASRYVMAAVIMLVLGGGAAAAFKLMRSSEDTHASTPVVPFGALAKAGPEVKPSRPAAAAQPVAAAQPERPEPPRAAVAEEPSTPPAAEPSAPPAAEPSAPPAAEPVVAPAVVATADTAPSEAVPQEAPPAPAPEPEPATEVAPEPAAAVVAIAEDELEDVSTDSPSWNPKAERAARLVDQGLSLAKQGRFGLAEASHLRALRVLPNYPRALVALVRVHLARRDGAEAVRWAKRLTKRQPARARNQLLLGDAQALRGDAKAARRAWLKAAKRGSATAKARLKSAKS